jgi:hypothetical protein
MTLLSQGVAQRVVDVIGANGDGSARHACSMTKLHPGANHSGRDVSAGIEAEPEGVIALDPERAAIWELASPFLKVRDNDAHTPMPSGWPARCWTLIPRRMPPSYCRPSCCTTSAGRRCRRRR